MDKAAALETWPSRPVSLIVTFPYVTAGLNDLGSKAARSGTDDDHGTITAGGTGSVLRSRTDGLASSSLTATSTAASASAAATHTAGPAASATGSHRGCLLSSGSGGGGGALRRCESVAGGGGIHPRSAKSVRWLDHVALQVAADVEALSASMSSTSTLMTPLASQPHPGAASPPSTASVLVPRMHPEDAPAPADPTERAPPLGASPAEAAGAGPGADRAGGEAQPAGLRCAEAAARELGGRMAELLLAGRVQAAGLDAGWAGAGAGRPPSSPNHEGALRRPEGAVESRQQQLLLLPPLLLPLLQSEECGNSSSCSSGGSSAASRRGAHARPAPQLSSAMRTALAHCRPVSAVHTVPRCDEEEPEPPPVDIVPPRPLRGIPLAAIGGAVGCSGAVGSGGRCASPLGPQGGSWHATGIGSLTATAFSVDARTRFAPAHAHAAVCADGGARRHSTDDSRVGSMVLVGRGSQLLTHWRPPAAAAAAAAASGGRQRRSSWHFVAVGSSAAGQPGSAPPGTSGADGPDAIDGGGSSSVRRRFTDDGVDAAPGRDGGAPVRSSSLTDRSRGYALVDVASLRAAYARRVAAATSAAGSPAPSSAGVEPAGQLPESQLPESQLPESQLPESQQPQPAAVYSAGPGLMRTELDPTPGTAFRRRHALDARTPEGGEAGEAEDAVSEEGEEDAVSEETQQRQQRQRQQAADSEHMPQAEKDEERKDMEEDDKEGGVGDFMDVVQNRSSSASLQQQQQQQRRGQPQRRQLQQPVGAGTGHSGIPVAVGSGDSTMLAAGQPSDRALAEAAPVDCLRRRVAAGGSHSGVPAAVGGGNSNGAEPRCGREAADPWVATPTARAPTTRRGAVALALRKLASCFSAGQTA
ncbi:hypothetical protein GPECTOR_20g476 [Gonium pectorale]|uniref:Uncharacterized protein n=1 Tax=Gonium pectorale TaxID=33097 RepID=A0A150GIH9_GONPE|nr:hypothetical protein GPECTOR_20g476 [Gonium pectorale]|eukprot:KXZ49619.1 hypothetical protein GPECTOR_20g476 [Gonium pectorale]